jgi:NAD-dependent DNA ligase
MRGCLKRGGLGEFLVGTDMPTHPDAIKSLRDLQDEYPKTFKLKRFQSPERRILHSKLYVFTSSKKEVAAIIGSSNLTSGGLGTNYEANVFLDEGRSLKDLLAYFQQLFGGAYGHIIDPSWLDKYTGLWTSRSKLVLGLRKAREKARRLAVKSPTGKEVLRRVKGTCFVFTGKIENWPRERRLYPKILSYRGRVVSTTKADYLVQGELGDRKTTRKLQVARKWGIPIITEEQFLSVLKREKRRRLRKR